MSYSDSNSIGLLMPNGNTYDYPGLNPSLFSTELGFTSQDQSDEDPIDDPDGEQPYNSCFGYLPNELDSPSLFFKDEQPYHSCFGYLPTELSSSNLFFNGASMENTELVLFHNEDQVEDDNGDPRNLYYEFDWDFFQSWFGLGEDEQELEPENDFNSNSDAMSLLEAILGY